MAPPHRKEKNMINRVNVVLGTILIVFVGCGGDDNGNDDTLLTGISGVVIAAIAIWFVVRAMKKRS